MRNAVICLAVAGAVLLIGVAMIWREYQREKRRWICRACNRETDMPHKGCPWKATFDKQEES